MTIDEYESLLNEIQETKRIVSQIQQTLANMQPFEPVRPSLNRRHQ